MEKFKPEKKNPQTIIFESLTKIKKNEDLKIIQQNTPLTEFIPYSKITSSEKETIKHIQETIIPQKKIEKQQITIFEISPTITSLHKQAQKHHEKVIESVMIDPTLTDNSVAYRRLSDENNTGWKLNPSDIADFYVLTQFIQSQPTSSGDQEDSTYLATEKAKTRITEIGRRLTVALAHEQLEEYDRFAKVDPTKLTQDLKDKLDIHFSLKPDADNNMSLEQKMNTYLSDFRDLLDTHASREDILKLFQGPTKEMFDTAVQILQTQQGGRWKVMAAAMRALMDPTYQLSEVLATMSPNGTDPESLKQFIDSIGDRRETFLIDRLINYVHNTGHVSARVSNHLPRSLSLLVAHGQPGMADYLLYYSSFINGSDVLSSKLRKGLIGEKTDDTVEAVVAFINDTPGLPEDYAYALMLEFDNPKITDALVNNRSLPTSPSHAYYLLNGVAKHDGRSRGRLRKKKK